MTSLGAIPKARRAAESILMPRTSASNSYFDLNLRSIHPAPYRLATPPVALSDTKSTRVSQLVASHYDELKVFVVKGMSASLKGIDEHAPDDTSNNRMDNRVARTGFDRMRAHLEHGLPERLVTLGRD
jgi:hypothetical protein